MTYAILLEHVAFEQITLWILGFSVINFARLFLAWHELQHFDEHPLHSARRYALGALAGGSCWGSLMLFHDPNMPVAVQLMMITTLVCLPPASLPSNAVHPPTFLAFALPIFVSLVSWGVFLAPGNNLAFTVVAIIYAGLILASGLRYALVLRDNLVRNAENRRLLRNVKEINSRLLRFAYQDPLTKLSNRRRFDEYADRLLQQAQNNGLELSLVLIDIDNFKEVNDTLGHEAGDRLLRIVAKRITTVSRHTELLTLERFEAARIGGDEFVVLYLGTPGEMHADAIAQRVLEAIQQPLELCGKTFAPRVSIGVAWIGARPMTWRHCCARPMPPCIAPSRPAGIASSITPATRACTSSMAARGPESPQHWPAHPTVW
ncbi:signal transduction protein [endosymbiont of unidentified scaly snail isolate Monju]|nr:signal transduction protein [endosymbiont of unidentified scaly snail isolate Monju]